MEKILEVHKSNGEKSKVLIGNTIDHLEKLLPEGKRIIIITDNNVYQHYSSIIDKYEKIVIGLGEEHKTHATLLEIYSELIEMGVDRSSFIVGFGGGIVTDMAGFAASTFMRGVPFGFVATTLLAQVDASVGGKNGVNVNGYKNMVGTFNQPDFVICDIKMLRTLPKREFRAGLAEIIKSGLVLDDELFKLFEKHDFEEFLENDELLFEIVSRAVAVKKHIVDMDEREMGERKKLNLGHTFAHAVEKCSRNFIHGEAVAIGMCTIAHASVNLGILTMSDYTRIKNVIKRMGLPIVSDVRLDKLLNALHSDKKKSADSISLILMDGIGKCIIQKTMFSDIEKLIS